MRCTSVHLSSEFHPSASLTIPHPSVLKFLIYLRAIYSTIIQRKFQKIQRKFWKSVFWHFKVLNIFKVCLMSLVCIPEVLTDLLTPILPHLYLTCVRWHMRQIWHFWHFWHKWHICYPTFVMSRYSNMGVKSCVRTSGIQTKAIKQIMNMFNG